MAKDTKTATKGKKVKPKAQYLSAHEQRVIAKHNRDVMNRYERLRSRENISESEYLSKMKNPESVLEIDNLHTYFFTDTGTVKAVDGVTFDIPVGKTVGVVGESGCGKSVTALSTMQLVPRPTGQIVEGEIRLRVSEEKVYDVAKMPTEMMRMIRGNIISMIFQEPMTSLNPVFKVGEQVDEVVELHNPQMTKSQVKQRTIDMFDLVKIANSEGVYEMFPYEFSGDTWQRVVLAMVLACDPALIIADEPTTALDVTIQAQILDILRSLKDQINSSIMLITHDLGVVAEMADFVVVMYAGRIVESGTVREVFHTPAHPYTVGLMASRPVINQRVDRLYSIPGKVPNPIDLPDHCYFLDRCEHAVDSICRGPYPGLVQLSETHFAACHIRPEMRQAREEN